MTIVYILYRAENIVMEENISYRYLTIISMLEAFHVVEGCLQSDDMRTVMGRQPITCESATSYARNIKSFTYLRLVTKLLN